MKSVFQRLPEAPRMFRMTSDPQWPALQTFPDVGSDNPFSNSVGETAGFSLHAGVAAKASERAKLESWGKKVKAPNETQDQTPAEKRASMTWAKRLKRVFDIGIETCSECGGDVRIVASIEDPAVIQKILGSQSGSGTAFFARTSGLA